MNKQKSSIDGFVPRRSNSQVGERHVINESTLKAPARKQLQSEDDLRNTAIGTPRPGRAIGRADIDASLDQIDEPEQGGHSRKLSRREKRRWKKDHRTKGQRVRRRIIVGIVLTIVIGLLAVGGYLAYKVLHAASNSGLTGNVFDLIQQQPLKEDKNGRSNFLIVGTSEDDQGHKGADLTDSIMVLSVNQKTKDAYTFSIPRDLYVNYGMVCFQGYKGKINEYFSCANDGTDAAAEQDRLAKTQAFIGDILGIDIQYGVHVNYTVMRDIVNAIGGSIQVKIEGNDGSGPSDKVGIMDNNFDWKCGATRAQRLAKCPPNGHFIDYEPGIQTLDAEHALYLAQARGANGSGSSYGLAQSNFDRERNQQKILVAIKDKAMTAGTLTNLGKVTGLIDALGDNLRTNVATKEIRTLMDLAQSVKNENIHSIDFYSTENMIFATGSIEGAGSVVYPKAGLFNYGPLRAYIQQQLTAEPFMKEKPQVSVYNASGTAGVAQTVADGLEAKGFTIGTVANAPEGTYGKATIYQINNTKPQTAAKLKQLFGVDIQTTAPPVSVTGDTDFVIIVGDAIVTQTFTN